MSSIDTSTKLCAVIGDPVEHSLSPTIHNAAFEALGLNYVYLAFHVTDVAEFIGGLRAMPSFVGVSVTIPHKRAVMDRLDRIDDTAQKIGSVNTITHENGALAGMSTDGPGTLRAFSDAGVELRDRNVLFLGAGGAVRAVAFAMADDAGVERITILGRNPGRVQPLIDDLVGKTSVDIGTGTFEADLETAMATHDVVIQGTPVGMHPKPGASILPNTAWLRPEQAVKVPHGWVWSIDKIADDLLEWPERWGASYWAVHDDFADELAPLVARLAGS